MSKKSKGKDAAKDVSPDIQALNELGKKLMRVPKSVVENKLKTERLEHETARLKKQAN